MKRTGFSKKLIVEKGTKSSVRGKKQQDGRKSGLEYKKAVTGKKTSNKTKPKTQAQLKKQLDAIFSIYIRQKYADTNGNVKCFTCGKILHWKKMQNGHFISRSYLSTRFHEDNVRPQDVGCNIFGKGKPLDFEEHLKVDLGDEYVENLKKLRHVAVKYDRHWYLDQIEKYKSLCNKNHTP